MPVSFTCPHCVRQTWVAEQYIGQSGPCAGCGKVVTVAARAPLGPPPPSIGDDAVVRMLIPVGRSIWAIAAGYLGLISVLLLPAPIALILGILAVRDIKRHPEKHGMGRAIFGLVMGGLFSLVLAFIIVVGAANGFR